MSEDAKRLAFLAEAGRVLSSSLDFETTLRSVARLCAAAIADYCVIDVVDEYGQIRRVATAHRSAEMEARTSDLLRFPPDPENPEGVPRVLSTGEPWVSTEVDEAMLRAGTQNDEHLRLVRELGVSCFMIVPLTIRDQVLGAITLVYSRGDQRYGPEDLMLAKELAGQAALAMENSRLYREAQADIAERQKAREELTRKNSLLQLLLDITTAANESRSFEEAVRKALQHVRTHTGWLAGHAYLRNSAGNLEPTGIWSLDDPERLSVLREVTEATSFPPGAGLPGRVLETGTVASIYDLTGDPGFHRARMATDLRVRSAFALPLVVGTEVVAVLEFFSERRIEPDADFREVMAHVGTQLGRVVERERADRALRESEQRFRQLAESIRDVFWIADLSPWRMLYVSPAYEEIWGRSIQEVYSDPAAWLEGVHPEDRAMVEAQIADQETDAQAMDFRVVRPDGTIRWINARSFPVQDERGRTVRVVGIAEDITEDKRAEAALRESEKQWRLLFESSPLPRWVYDEETLRILDVNEAALSHYGYSRDEFLSMSIRDLRKTGEIPRLEEILNREGARWGEFRHRKRDGTRIDVEVTSQPVILKDRPARLVVVHDITERKRVEAERLRLLALEHKARENAEDAVRTRDEVLRMASHDLRNPIHTIKMSASLLSEVQLPSEKRAQQIGVIRRTADHMERLVQGLLDLKRIEAGHGISVEPQPSDVATLLREGCELFWPQAEEKGVSIVREVAANIAPVLADTERVFQVLWNLTGNAIKFTPEGGRVTLRAEEHNEEILFAVADTGPGISPDEVERLFDPYWQAKRTARLGTGLGLPISKAIVEAHGGRIWAESEPGRGTAFRFTLPKVRSGTP